MLGFDKKFLSAANQAVDPGLQAMIDAVENAKENNPFVVYEATGNDLVYAIFDIAKNNDGVHIEKALGIVGALAGYSCAIAAALLSENATKVATEETQLAKIDALLIESNTSFYRVLMSKASVLGAKSDFDIADVVLHSTMQKDAPGFGVPRLPKGRFLGDLPLNFVLNHWQELIGILTRYDDQFAAWHVSWAAAGAQLMEMGQSVISAEESLHIMMECAVPMSRIGPSHFATPKTSKAA